ncbi:uncharacterized protein N7459_005817 [Penicillium hispanicum]|uniref:uncharacterized protein n=1 Tax=Penicillium hispanicum TaxID=1080232 RepID=UPI00253FCD73|nr:uncharacterized protein N7459_005817 [Penicillium hispanicum]KAJ5579832.1 hypothetical protein N7459_005817 [Penicillium hispanicum]
MEDETGGPERASTHATGSLSRSSPSSSTRNDFSGAQGHRTSRKFAFWLLVCLTFHLSRPTADHGPRTDHHPGDSKLAKLPGGPYIVHCASDLFILLQPPLVKRHNVICSTRDLTLRHLPFRH